MALSPTPSLKRPGRRDPFRYCGRVFTSLELDWIRALTASNPPLNRAALSRRVCEELGWRRQDGRLKDMSCRVAMLRMEKDGLMVLPPPLTKNGNGRLRPRAGAESDPRQPIVSPADALGTLDFRIVSAGKDSTLWNELIERYHYLGYQPLPGAQMRYLIWSDSGLLAAVGYGAAAWKLGPRDRFIGWSDQQRQANLHRVVNNARFLIVPWVNSRNLASRILAGIAKRLPRDWQARYGYAPVLLETFVERDRYRGTCYRAANWIDVGCTQGRGKLDRKNCATLPVKRILLYPLHKKFRLELCISPADKSS